jgi:hypothetical protein
MECLARRRAKGQCVWPMNHMVQEGPMWETLSRSDILPIVDLYNGL